MTYKPTFIYEHPLIFLNNYMNGEEKTLMYCKITNQFVYINQLPWKIMAHYIIILVSCDHLLFASHAYNRTKIYNFYFLI